ncbi:MAG: hypothetical protein DRP95_01825 [Candidatus Latescibacterota bacterium]|nr:MAG: hypothetical protein DRP95_01825 [Candidatus Latescibacterota bacterium]
MKTRDMVEELIEESYLLGLTEDQIWEDLRRFVATCESTIREHVRDEKTLDRLLSYLNSVRERAYREVVARIRDAGALIKPDGSRKTRKELLAEQAAKNKRMVLQAIRECDPELAARIEQKRFPVLEVRLQEARRTRYGRILLGILYGLLWAVIAALIYLSHLTASQK